MSSTVTISYLEMTSAADLRPKFSLRAGLEFLPIDPPDWTINRQFYITVGGPWKWTDCLSWSDKQWRANIERPEVHTWLAYVDGVQAGYAQLEQQSDQNVEISYFGLLPTFLGQHLGGHFLTETIRRAWKLNAARVWVHTCTHDHPAALGNYLARGFRLYQTETKPIT